MSVQLIIRLAKEIADLTATQEFWANASSLIAKGNLSGEYQLAHNQQIRLHELIEGEKLVLFERLMKEMAK